MDISNIPRTFWHSLSFCMVAATLGLLVIAYKASTVTIEIATAKIELSSALSKAREIKSELEAESKRLASSNRLLEEKLEPSGKSEKSASIGIFKEELRKELEQSTIALQGMAASPSRFEALDAKIQSVEKAISKI